jgi:hypothetical protein
MLLNSAGSLRTVREMVALLEERFRVEEAEQAVSEWRATRPDDPDVLEALVDLLLKHGHGRCRLLVRPRANRHPQLGGSSRSSSRQTRARRMGHPNSGTVSLSRRKGRANPPQQHLFTVPR